MAAMRILRDAFSTRGLTAVLEAPVLSSGGDRRADVLVTASDGVQRIAIEVQHQPIDYEQIYRRTAAYIAAGVPVIWVALLNDTVWQEAERSENKRIIKRFAPRSWQKWAHAYGMAELWFIDVNSGHLWKGKLPASMIHIEHTTWYDSYGNEDSASGAQRRRTGQAQPATGHPRTRWAPTQAYEVGLPKAAQHSRSAAVLGKPIAQQGRHSMAVSLTSLHAGNSRLILTT